MPPQALILNIDDNEPARYARSRVLSRAGFSVLEAGTGAGCLTLFAEHAPDLILLDINLPDLNGIEVSRRLKSAPQGDSVIVLQISATATAAPHATAALNSGADAYLAEPVDPEVLVATVKALLRLRTAERALAVANSRLEAVNRDLKKSNESLEEFAYVASHDLQEPLRTIMNFAAMLQRRAGDRLTDADRKDLQFILNGADRMSALIRDLLHYSKIGQAPATFAIVDFGGVLRWALENLRELIAETNAVVTADDLPEVFGDEAQLRQLVQNLVANAIKYRQPDVRPHVQLKATRNGENWEFCVEDNGIGIDAKYVDSIFTPFKRLHGRDIPGTGIGLAVCRKVVQAHGGRIWVESTVKAGSRFYFTLPHSSAQFWANGT